MSTINGSESRNMGIMMPFAMVIGMISVCLLFTQIYRKRHKRQRRDRQLEIQRQSSNDGGESVATKWSTTGVYNGVRGYRGPSHSYGERIHLLENSSGSLYYT